MVRKPKQLIDLYWDEVWNNGRVELIREICADPLMRYDVSGAASSLTHDQQIARVAANVAKLSPRFTHEVLLADAAHVASVWNMTSPLGDDYSMCGIEVFAVADGRLVSCWNAPYAKGRWGHDGDPTVAAHALPPPCISTGAAISAEWLQHVFAASGVHAPRIASIIDVKPAGHGTTAQTLRARIAYNDAAAGAPESVIVKLPAADAEVRANMQAQGIYRREIAAYDFFGDDGNFRRPKTYLARTSDDGGFTLVMEDLAAWSPGDQIAGCSVAQAEAVMHECTQLHLQYWGDPRLPDLEWLRRMGAIAHPFAQLFKTGAEIMRANHADTLAQELDVIDRVAALIEPFFARPLDNSTIIHGDLRVDNVLFQCADGTEQACLVDFQVAAVGNPLFDLAYFLTGSLTPEDRRQNERRFVAAHSAALAGVDPGYDAQGAWDRYRAHAIVGLAATVVAAAVIGRNAHIDRLLTALAQRNCAAIVELDSIAAARQLINASISGRRHRPE